MQTCCESDQSIVDFWATDRGASHLNGTGYEEYIWNDQMLSTIHSHNASDPLLLFYTPHVAHCPLQVAQRSRARCVETCFLRCWMNHRYPKPNSTSSILWSTMRVSAPSRPSKACIQLILTSQTCRTFFFC